MSTRNNDHCYHADDERLKLGPARFREVIDDHDVRDEEGCELHNYRLGCVCADTLKQRLPHEACGTGIHPERCALPIEFSRLVLHVVGVTPLAP